jgi:transcriptional regulator with XRE-family HTH domain
MQLSRTVSKGTLTAIGAEIRRRRQSLDISQSALATSAGVHTNVIGRTERGIYNPTILTLHAIAGALDVSLVKLLRRALK